MSEFDALFAFYALLLGLAMANVATAFAEMYKARARVVIGWTIPLLGVVVLLSASHQWLSLFRAQADMTLGIWPILTCLGMALPYIFISQVIRPRYDEITSLEAYYAQHRRVLAAALLVPLITSSLVNVAYAVTLHEDVWLSLINLLIYQGFRFACVIPMLIWPSRAVQRASLIVLAGHTVLMMA